jgi:hypothetical protein
MTGMTALQLREVRRGFLFEALHHEEPDLGELVGEIGPTLWSDEHLRSRCTSGTAALLASGVSPVGRFTAGVSPVGRFTAGVSLVGRFGGGTLGLGTAVVLGLAIAPAPTLGVDPVTPVLGGAGARVIGLVGARPIAGFAPGS